jgi:hypothetical protein
VLPQVKISVQLSKSGCIFNIVQYIFFIAGVVSNCLFPATLSFVKLKYFSSGSSVAAWLSETVLRGRGPGDSGFESHQRGRIFSKGGTSAGPWMCVYVFQGLTVGWWKEERHSSDTTARSAGFESQAGWASHGCCVVLSRKEKGEERVGVGGRGKYPGASPHIRNKKEEKNKPTAKVPDRPNGERGKAITKKKKLFIIHHNGLISNKNFL